MQIRGLPRPAAEGAAFDIILVEFLNRTHPDTRSEPLHQLVRQAKTADATLLPIGVGVRHGGPHPDCWEARRTRRRAEAIDQLAAMWIGWKATKYRPKDADVGEMEAQTSAKAASARELRATPIPRVDEGLTPAERTPSPDGWRRDRQPAARQLLSLPPADRLRREVD